MYGDLKTQATITRFSKFESFDSTMKHHFNNTFLFLLLTLAGIGAYFVLQPYLVAFLVAFVVSQLFDNWYQKTLKMMGKKKKSLASLTISLLIFLLIFLPVTLITVMGVNEARNVSHLVQENNILEKTTLSIQELLSDFGIDISQDRLQSTLGVEKISQGLQNFGSFFVSVASKTTQGIFSFLMFTFAAFFSLYYFFKDGKKFTNYVMRLSPLRDKQEKMLLDKFIGISRATLKGSLVIAVVQATLTGIVFLITGTPSVILLSLLTLLFSLIPLLGSFVVWAPVGIITLAYGNIWQGILILAFGAIVVGTVDNLLRPILVGNDAQLHPLLVLFSTLGGIAFFGMAGFFLGPVLIVLLLTLLDIYHIEFKDDLDEMNYSQKIKLETRRSIKKAQSWIKS